MLALWTLLDHAKRQGSNEAVPVPPLCCLPSALQQVKWTRERLLAAFLCHARLAVELQDMKQQQAQQQQQRQQPGWLPPDATQRLREPLFQLGMAGTNSVRLALAVRATSRGLLFEKLRPGHLQPAGGALTIRFYQRCPEVREAVLRCDVLCCAVLYCAGLGCAVLCCAALCCGLRRCGLRRCTLRRCAPLRCAVPSRAV